MVFFSLEYARESAYHSLEKKGYETHVYRYKVIYKRISRLPSDYQRLLHAHIPRNWSYLKPYVILLKESRFCP